MAQTVGDIMTRQVVAVHEEDNMMTIREGMDAFGMRHVPVIDGGKLVGLLSHRDMLRFTDSQYAMSAVRQSLDERRSEVTFVASVMTRDVQTVRPDTPITTAAQMLLKHKYGCLPVTTDDGTLVGIVTEHDFLKVLVDTLQR